MTGMSMSDFGTNRHPKDHELLAARGLTMRFGGLTAVDAVDFSIPAGRVVSLIGPNGAGKTTFFNVVTGLVRPDGGRIAFEGQPLAGLRPNAIVARGIARTFQSILLFANMTVLENALVGEHCRLRATVPGAVIRPPSVVAEEARARTRAREVLAFAGLAGKEDDLARKAEKAIALPGAQNAFRRMHLNEWTEQAERWIDIAAWDACAGAVSLELLRGRPCFGGLDLSTTTDVTALAWVFPPHHDDDLWRVLSRYFVPAEHLRKRAERDRAR